MHDSILSELEQLFLALSDKTRLRLLAIMASGEVAVGYLADTLGESQPKTSRHLAYLRGMGLVATRRDGKWVYYSVQFPADKRVAAVLDAALTSIRADEVRDEKLVRGHGTDQRHPEPANNEYISEDTYMDDWVPAEMEIHLL